MLAWASACSALDERHTSERAEAASPPQMDMDMADKAEAGADSVVRNPEHADAADEAETPKAVVAMADPTPESVHTHDHEDAQDEDDDDSDWVGPPEVIPDCEGKLETAGVEFTASRIPLHETKGGYYCGAEQIVRYRGGPGGISWGGGPKVTCGVALAMAKMEAIVQEEAERYFERRIKRIKHMGTYNCREMANYPGWVSEHSYANAIDIKEFHLRGGGTISVLDHYAKTGTEAKTKRAKFLRAVARRLYDERVFSVVLTPSFDRAHRNHFHLDMARYSVDGV
ncbi:MAG: extensin family protein [Myxococcota bacterium]